MISQIINDFNVRKVASHKNWSLFAALRQGGTDTNTNQGEDDESSWPYHPAGIWHFVLLKDCGQYSNYLLQYHIPRFEMAAALQQQDRFFHSENYKKPIYANWLPFPAMIFGRNSLSFITPTEELLEVESAFVMEMKRDLDVLEQAKGLIQFDGQLFSLPGCKTVYGNQIQSESQKIMEAIAFEKLTLNDLDARNFGVFSAFCTYADFDSTIVMRENTINELAAEQLLISPEEISKDDLEVFNKVQEKIFDRHFWGKNISIEKTSASNILSRGMQSLTRTQRLQFILMNGMHNSGLFKPLAAILGIVSFAQYADWVCQCFQPDSTDEQERRAETSYINLYGKLARPLSCRR